ncbi:hypothetical protein [Novispirillum itersonii]|uniref:ABC-type transporter Mla subunit MlaD n=1 Tax=Novispirillum itersonii TaxID=189 RepID=A0A7W9ZKL9_NOVIT|nr:hypothetical protein [Novispirillum itersonii]MBB6211959.1 ABC-type transporter Mla subunit MlaD [Novispirillum itersonii]
MSALRSLCLCAALSLLPLSAMAQGTTVDRVTSTITSTAQTVDSAAKKADAVSQSVDQATKAADTVKKTLGQETTAAGNTAGKAKDAVKDAARDTAKAIPEKAQKYGNSAERRMDDLKKKHGKKN